MEVLLKEIKAVVTETRDLVYKMEGGKIDVQNDSIGHYSRGGDVIGDGSMGIVYEVKDDKDITYAMKVINMEGNRLNPQLAREISVLYDIKHSNIVQLEDVYICGNYVCMIMEHAGEDLNTFLQLYGTQDSETTKTWMKEILMALDFLHKKGVVHRDIKPENIMVGSDKKLKIADFGSVKCFGDADSSVTTLPFRAPEILLGCGDYGKEGDIWAVGCIFAEMVEGDGLFGVTSDSELGIIDEIFRKIGTPSSQNSLYSLFPKNVNQYPEASQIVPRLDTLGNDLIKKMLVIDPVGRITAEDALNHPYFKPLILVESSKVAEAIEFYKSVFGAQEVSCVTYAKTKADQELPPICAQLKVASTTFLIANHTSDALNTTGLTFLLEMEDFQAAVDSALNAGAVSVDEIAGGEGAGYGSRVRKVKDPYGVTWEITSLV